MGGWSTVEIPGPTPASVHQRGSRNRYFKCVPRNSDLEQGRGWHKPHFGKHMVCDGQRQLLRDREAEGQRRRVTYLRSHGRLTAWPVFLAEEWGRLGTQSFTLAHGGVSRVSSPPQSLQDNSLIHRMGAWCLRESEEEKVPALPVQGRGVGRPTVPGLTGEDEVTPTPIRPLT